jgi:hypothetical protein
MNCFFFGIEEEGRKYHTKQERPASRIRKGDIFFLVLGERKKEKKRDTLLTRQLLHTHIAELDCPSFPLCVRRNCVSAHFLFFGAKDSQIRKNDYASRLA